MIAKEFRFLFLLCYAVLEVSAQDTLTTENVSAFTQHFTIENFQMKGAGAKTLLEECEDARFVLLGETHENADISIFTTCLIPILHDFGFRHFITENGNTSLQILLREAQAASDVERSISAFLSKEYQRLQGIPVPFCSGVEDAQFIETALKHKMIFCGIDQEHFYSYPLLFDELVSLNSNHKSKALHATAVDFLLEQYALSRKDAAHPFFQVFRESVEVQSFFNSLDTANPRIKQIISDINMSISIYEMNGKDRGKSFAMRGNLMRSKLKEFYIPNSKVLIKMGAFHTLRGLSPLGIEDIGQQVSDLAKATKAKDLNLYFMFRYYVDEEEPNGYFDNSEGGSVWLKERNPFFQQGHVSEWTIIDLRALKKWTEEEGIFVYNALLEIMNQRDFVILPPATRDVELNYIRSLE